jgi:alanyl aminopeptidase
MAMRTLIICTLTIFLLTACGQKSEPESPEVTTQAEVAVEVSIPMGQLGNAVTPHHYRLELTLLPEQETFSGVTEIDVTINTAARTIYLHGNELAVESVKLTVVSGDSHQGRYQQVDKSGVA